MTTQTPRERVKRCLKFEGPDRVPRQMWRLPWFDSRYPEVVKQVNQEFPDDIGILPPPYQPSPRVQGDPFAVGSYTDEWGCVFENIHEGVIGEVREPIIADVADMEKIQPPWEVLPSNPEKARDEVNRTCDESDLFWHSGCCARPWERYQFLRGSENAMLDLHMYPEKVAKGLKIIQDYYLKEMEFWATTNTDALFCMDDWGSQLSLLIPPDIWREVFKPLYREYGELAKASGKFLFMHSDGYIMDIYDDLIEAGIDAINSQIFLMDMEELAQKVKGRITFWGEIDRQHVMVSQDEEEVREAVRKVKRHLYDPAGGVIAQFEAGPGHQPQNPGIIFDEWG